MPVPAVDADKRGDAYQKGVKPPVEGIDEQGLVPDPQVMHVLFARLMAALTQRVRAQPVGPVPSCVRLRVVVKFGALPLTTCHLRPNSPLPLSTPAIRLPRQSCLRLPLPPAEV